MGLACVHMPWPCSHTHGGHLQHFSEFKVVHSHRASRKAFELKKVQALGRAYQGCTGSWQGHMAGQEGVRMAVRAGPRGPPPKKQTEIQGCWAWMDLGNAHVPGNG